MKIFLIILAVIFGLIALVLIIPVTARFTYKNGKMYYVVKYAFYSIIGSDLKRKPKKEKEKKKKKPEKIKKNKKQSEKKKSEQENKSDKPYSTPVENEKNKTEIDYKASYDKTEEEDTFEKEIEDEKSSDKEKSKKTLSEKIDFFLDIWNAAKKPVRKIFKGFRFTKVYLDIKVSDEDAYDCALKYGRMCFAVYNGLELANEIFTVKPEHIKVYCVFGEEKSEYDISFTAKFRLGTAVGAGIMFLLTYYFKIYRIKKKKMKMKRKKIKTSVRKTA